MDLVPNVTSRMIVTYIKPFVDQLSANNNLVQLAPEDDTAIERESYRKCL